MLPLRLLAFVLVLPLVAASPARAGGLDQVRRSGTVTCGAEPRAGFVEEAPDRGIRGAAVALCRAVALAVLGPGGRVRFHLYQGPRDFDAIRSGEDDVAFLSGGAIAERDLSAAILPGPVVFIDPIALMVPARSPVHVIADLAGKTICLLTGSLGQRAVLAEAERLRVRFSPMAFQEASEMEDGYRAGRCVAVAGLGSELAGFRETGPEGDRLLDPPLGIEPVIAATATTDGRWSALVAWVMDALILADLPSNGWQAAGADALPLRSRPPGLRPHWRADIVLALGGYGAIMRRSLGSGSGLTARLNAPWPSGLLIVPSVQ